MIKDKFKLLFNKLIPKKSKNNFFISIDEHPWEHPFLTPENIKRFREYSEAIWEFALNYYNKHQNLLKCAFAVNMAQNMYKWAKLVSKYGHKVALYLHPLDNSAISLPHWEEFDGEYENIFDGKGFLKSYDDIKVAVPYFRIEMDSSDFLSAYQAFYSNNDRKTLLKLLAQSPLIRPEVLMQYEGFHPYYKWAKELSKYDVIYIASSPLAAYASGVPYCALSVGGDLQYDCGRGDDYGKLMLLAFNAARFLTITNPHSLAHCRRLGLTNAIYLPYVIDDSTYCPGEGKSHYEWEKQYGKGVYILVTSRIDAKFKGYNEDIFNVLISIAMNKKDVKFIFLKWGKDVKVLESKINENNLANQFILLKPVGKKRLLDYYRSCDIVIDHFVYGYYGTTMLEAASIGKPVIMKIRKEHYLPLYNGDVAPVINVNEPKDLYSSLLLLIENKDLRQELGIKMRKWLVRNHGEDKMMPLMLAILNLTANRIPLPQDLKNPLLDEETKEEKKYHESCLQI